MEDKKSSFEDLEESPGPKFDPELIATIRKQVLNEIKSDEEKQRQQKLLEREEERQAYDDYVTKMKESTDPWVDIQGWVETEQGVRVELDWNDSFVKHLREQGVKGADDDQTVQMWVTLLLRDMADQMTEESPEKSEFS